ncbi:MAG TPA: PHP domain-containing protein, partial [Candidatus Paceibacterota bacterium]|nr:PHP domain-containing protein [Candidatus Paceibacterota bacterium]
MLRADFVHLHTHSHYSLLEALPRIPELVAAAKKDGMSALALTDNGNMYGAIEFYKECKAQGLKPIIGVDLFVAPRTRHDKEHRVDDQLGRLILLAKNETGYKNLLKLVSDSYLEGFYSRPRIDRELIEKYHEGLIAILPSHGGEVAYALRHGDKNRASQSLEWHKKLFGDDCYLEITRHPEIPDHEKEMKALAAFAKENKAQIVAAHDVYYLEPGDGLACDLVNKIRTGGVLDRENGEYRMRDFSFLPQKKMQALFKDMPEALENAGKIAEECNLELELGKWLFPDFQIPDGRTPDDELRELA